VKLHTMPLLTRGGAYKACSSILPSKAVNEDINLPLGVEQYYLV